MQLQLCTWKEVEDYLQTSRGIMIPIGSTEQHGPNGLIGTDAICPETIARDIGERAKVLVAPTINFGMAQHHMAFAGTVSLRPSTLMAVVSDVIASLARHGFTRLYFLNGHGGNYDSVRAAFSEFYAQTALSASPVQAPRCKLMNWWMVRGVRKLSRDLFGEAEGMHATPSEVSLTYHAYPQAIKNVSMSPRLAASGGFYDAEDFRQRFPDGRMGSDPSLASGEAGEKILAAAAEGILADYQAFMRDV